jgi:hypothetical protein
MKVHRYACFLYALALMSSSVRLPAEAELITDAEDVSIEFSLLAWKTDLPRLSYSSSSEFKIEALESSTRSELQHYSGPADLSFHLDAGGSRFSSRLQTSRNSSSEGRVFSSVTFPPGATRFTVLVIKEDRNHYRMYPIAEDGELLPSQFIKLHNFTEYDLAITYNEGDGVQLASHSTAYIRLDQTAVVLYVAREEEGQWRRVFNSVVELNEQLRANVIFAAGDGRSVAIYKLPPWPDIEK